MSLQSIVCFLAYAIAVVLVGMFIHAVITVLTAVFESEWFARFTKAIVAYIDRYGDALSLAKEISPIIVSLVIVVVYAVMLFR